PARRSKLSTAVRKTLLASPHILPPPSARRHSAPVLACVVLPGLTFCEHNRRGPPGLAAHSFLGQKETLRMPFPRSGKLARSAAFLALLPAGGYLYLAARPAPAATETEAAAPDLSSEIRAVLA